MDVLTRDSEFVNCPHCSHQMRRGMIRCRECNGTLADDFVLSNDVAARVTVAPTCRRCGAELDPGVDDCPKCASQMLDQFLQAPRESPAVPPGRRAAQREAGVSESRLRPPPSLPPISPPPSGKLSRAESTRPRPPADEEDHEPGTDALYENETSARARRSAPTTPEFDRLPASRTEAEVPAAGQACQSLLLALHTTDAGALCSVVTALGKLGDRAALGPVERLMANPEIRVRRAAAEALILLGHPKGEGLLEIAERRVAAPPPDSARSAPAKKRSSGAPIRWDALVKPGVAVLLAAVLGGGVWWWQSGGGGSSKSKSLSKLRASAKKGGAKKSGTKAGSQPALPAPAGSPSTD